MTTVDQWSAILRDYSCDESSDDEGANHRGGSDIVSVRRHARKIIESVAPLVPADRVPEELRDAHDKACRRNR